jgi:hypothetical protein
LCGGTAAAMLITGWRSWRSEDHSGVVRFAVLYGPACLLYCGAILYRSAIFGYLFDRYLIVIMPLLILPLLLHLQQRIREAPPVWGWGIVGVFALFGIVMTHDYLAAGRARVQAASAVTSAGIARTHVSAGLEYDGWTQLEQTGRIPSPEEQAAVSRSYPISPPFWFWSHTPSVKPVYIVTHSRLRGLEDSQFPPVAYTAWLPPFRREVLTQKAPE